MLVTDLISENIDKYKKFVVIHDSEKIEIVSKKQKELYLNVVGSLESYGKTTLIIIAE